MSVIVILLSSCGKKSYVVFDYNCNGAEYHKCELKNNKLNCSVETPTCEGYEFKGWYKANEYETPVDLFSKFSVNEIIYARWTKKDEEPSSLIENPSSQEEPSSSQIIEEPSSQTPVIPQPIEETYTITFNTNGGSGGQSGTLSVKYNNNLPSINSTKPTRGGYIFMGWMKM